MAQKTVVEYTDDIDGTPIKDDGGTVTFAYEGITYEIDLNKKNRDALEKALAPYINVAHRVGRATGKRGKSQNLGPSAQEIRDWARDNGFDIPARGRIPKEIKDAFNSKKK